MTTEPQRCRGVYRGRHAWVRNDRVVVMMGPLQRPGDPPAEGYLCAHCVGYVLVRGPQRLVCAVLPDVS